MKSFTAFLTMLASVLAGSWLFALKPGFNINYGGFNPFTAAIFFFVWVLIAGSIVKGRQNKEYKDTILKAAKKIVEKEDN